MKRARYSDASPVGSKCLLRTCRESFEPRQGGREQEFCSPTCRVTFFREARVVGAALLKRSLTDPEMENLIEDLLKLQTCKT